MLSFVTLLYISSAITLLHLLSWLHWRRNFSFAEVVTAGLSCRLVASIGVKSLLRACLGLS